MEAANNIKGRYKYVCYGIGKQMIQVMIVTVAGAATRFNKSINRESNVLKCLYNEGSMRDSLLCRLLHNFEGIDKYIIVGGYYFETLKTALEIEDCFEKFRDRIVLVNNPQYEEYGSGYSLYIGLKEAIKCDFDEIIFAEGDLYIDSVSCEKISSSDMNIVTTNTEPIYANKAVALYLDIDGRIHYIYDTNHGILEVEEPFTAILNSGQIWKFADAKRTREVFYKLSDEHWRGTNLTYIEDYFKGLNCNDYEVVQFGEWINCNTVEDYRKIRELEDVDEINQ